MDRKIRLKSLNPYITCNICKGYLIDATAITECLHTFCKSCIIKRLEASTTCPTCDIVIHHSYPRQYINYDRTMQDIVYKLVTGLFENEIQREKDFYRQRGLPYPKEILIQGAPGNADDAIKSDKPANLAEGNEETIEVEDELISVCLDCTQLALRQFFIRVPIKTKIIYIMKFVARKLCNQAHLANRLEILCNSYVLDKDETLKYVFLTKWRLDEAPFLLKCRQIV